MKNPKKKKRNAPQKEQNSSESSSQESTKGEKETGTKNYKPVPSPYYLHTFRQETCTTSKSSVSKAAHTVQHSSVQSKSLNMDEMISTLEELLTLKEKLESVTDSDEDLKAIHSTFVKLVRDL